MWRPTTPAAPCAGAGSIFLAFLLFHLADLTWGIQPMAPETWDRGEVYANFIATFCRAPVTLLYVVAMVLLGIHLYHGAWSMFQSLGINNPRFNAGAATSPRASPPVMTVGQRHHPLAVLFGFAGVTLTLTSRRQGPRRAPRGQVGQPQVRWSGWSTRPTSASSRSSSSAPGSPARRRRPRSAELGYNVEVFTLPRQPRRAHSHRRPGRDQRRQELPERRRQRLPAVLRHHQGRRLPRAARRTSTGCRRCRVNIIDQCVGPGGAVRPRVRRPARQPLIRWRPGVPHLLRRGQTGQQLLLGAYQAMVRQVTAGTVKLLPAVARCSTSWSRKAGRGNRWSGI